LPTPEQADSDYPLQAYAASKKGAEVLCHAYHYLYGIDVTIVRYFTVYGPAGRPDMVMFRFAQWIREGQKVKINGDGDQTRGFTYIDDIARGTILGLQPLGYEIINLGGHESIKINDLIQMFETLIGRKAQVQSTIQRTQRTCSQSWAAVDKAERVLVGSSSFASGGVANLVTWYEAEAPGLNLSTE
jgi:nucleoside-diphosphate-sugar epimerase